MKKLALLLVMIGLALPLLAQNEPPVELIVDGAGNPFPTGTGTPPVAQAPPFTCVTNVNGALQFCDFSGSGSTTNPAILNREYYVAGTNSTCSGGTTALDCAWIAATAFATANSVSPIIHLAPGVNQTCTGISTTAAWRPSIMGNGMYGSTIQQSCAISTPTVFYGCSTGTSDANPSHIERVTIDANNNAPQALAYFAHNLSFLDHIVARGATGPNNFVQLGSTSCSAGTTGSTFQVNVNDIYVDGKGTGPASWAAGTVTISGGTPSVAITSGGLYNHQNPPGYLIGYGAGANPCSTMGTVTVNTTASSSQWTVSSVTLSGFSGCVQGVGAYIYIPDMPPAKYAVDLQFFTDSVVNMLVTNGVGQTASIHNANSANTFVGAHPYNSYVGVEDDAGGNWYGVDCDSNHVMFNLTAPARVHGCNVFYNNATMFPGAAVYLLGNGSNGSTIEGTNAINGSENADYHEFVTTAGGPVDTAQGVWPSNSVDFGSPTAAPNLVPAKHDGTANQVDEFVGFTQFATSTANSPSFGRKWQQSVWNGTTHLEETWGMGPIVPASGTPTQDFFHFTVPTNEIVSNPGSVGWIFDSAFPAISGTNFNSVVQGLRGSYFPTGGPATSIGWNWQIIIGSGINPTNTFSMQPTACLTGPCNISAPGFTSTVATGTPPVTVASTTPVANLALAADTQLPTNVTPGSCTSCSATYNAQGMVTAYSSGNPASGRIFASQCTGTATSSATNLSLFGMGGNNIGCTGTFQAVGIVMISSGTLANLAVRCAQTGVSASSGVFNIHDLRAGVDTVTPITITYGTTAASTIVSDTTHTYAYQTGDLVRVEFTTQATETLGYCSVTFSY